MSIITPEGLIPAEVDLSELDGNAFAIIGTVIRELSRAGNPREVIETFRSEAMSADYDHVIQTAMAYTS